MLQEYWASTVIFIGIFSQFARRTLSENCFRAVIRLRA